VAFALVGCGSEQGSGGATPTVTISPTTTATPTSSAPATPSATGTIPGGPDPSDPVPLPTVSKGTTVTLTGIPERGVEASCLLLDKYLLIGGDRALLGSGAKVTVTGHTEPDMMSFCQQGIYLVVDTVTKTG
jgi:hypothetical protein